MINFEKIYNKFNKKHLQEIGTTYTMKSIAKRLERCLKDPLRIGELEDFLILTVGKSANSNEGIYSDDTGIASLGTRITTDEQIYRMLKYSCNFVIDSPIKAKEFLIKNKEKVGKILKKCIQIGNIKTLKKEFDLASYFKEV